MFTRQPSEARAGNAPSGLVRLGQGAAVQPTIGGLDWLSSAARAPGLKRDGVVTPGGASGYPTTLESLSHVADSLHTRRGRCETGEKETLRISTDYAGFFSYVVRTARRHHTGILNRTSRAGELRKRIPFLQASSSLFIHSTPLGNLEPGFPWGRLVNKRV